MSQFHFAEEDADSPQSAPAGAPQGQTGTPQTGVPQPPVPITSSPSVPTPTLPDLPAPSFSLPTEPAVTPKASTPVVNTPVLTPPLPAAPAVGAPPVVTPPVPKVASAPPAPAAASAITSANAPQPSSGAAQPKPLQPRGTQGGAAPGTPQSRPTPKVATPTIPTPDPTAKMAAAAPATPDAETLAQSHVPTNDAGAQLYAFGQGIEQALDKLEGPASWVLRVAFPIAMLCLAFMLAAVLTGAVGKVNSSPSANAVVELIRNLNLAGQGFKWSLVITAIAALLAGYQDNRLGAIVAAIGLVLHFGAPIGLKTMGGDNVASAAIASQLQATGRVLLILGALKGIIDVFAFLWTLPDTIKTKYASVGANRPIEAKQRLRAKEANMLSPCWNLPFCREAIRKMCPAFLARTTCWKFKRGCYCDEEMIARIVRGDTIDSIKAPTKISQSRQPPCGRCYIYLEHQTYKFRMLSPLALPTSIAISYVLWPAYTRVFTTFEATTNSLWRGLTFTSITPKAVQASPDAQAQMAAVQIDPAQMAMYTQWIFGLLAGFFILIYLSKFIEWAIFKAKW